METWPFLEFKLIPDCLYIDIKWDNYLYTLCL